MGLHYAGTCKCISLPFGWSTLRRSAPGKISSVDKFSIRGRRIYEKRGARRVWLIDRRYWPCCGSSASVRVRRRSTTSHLPRLRFSRPVDQSALRADRTRRWRNVSPDAEAPLRGSIAPERAFRATCPRISLVERFLRGAPGRRPALIDGSRTSTVPETRSTVLAMVI